MKKIISIEHKLKQGLVMQVSYEVIRVTTVRTTCSTTVVREVFRNKS